RRWWFFLGLSLFALTIAFGGHTPVYRIWYELLPGTKRFRAPSISFFLVSMSLVAMAAIALEAIAARLDQRSQRAPQRGHADADPALPRFGTWLLGIGGLALLGLIAAAVGNDGSARAAARVAGWLRFAFVLGIVLALLWAWSRRALTSTALALALALVTVVDLWLIDRRFFETRESPDETFAADGVVRFLQSQPQPSRVWVLPLGGGAGYRREPNYLMRFDIAQAGGEHGNQLQRYNEFVGAGEETYVDWHNFLAGLVDPTRAHMLQFLDAANIRYLIAAVPVGGPFPVVYSGPDGVVLENPSALPRAWLVGDAVAVPAGSEIETMSAPGFDFRTTAIVDAPLGTPLPGGPVTGTAQFVTYEPDRVVLRTNADRDALLVLADSWYPDWRVTVDGRGAHLYRANHAFRGVQVPAGSHEVEFVFAPAALRRGFIIWVAGLALLVGYAAWFVVRRRRRPEATAAAA
ncbi:MAG TPA: YfhO family protein, partial [Terriglobales bacterium]|nr:YfhO family protein [Terriglobales bacterium]